MKPEYLALIENFRLMDDIFMSKCLEKRVSQFKNSEEGRHYMCKAMERFGSEAITADMLNAVKFNTMLLTFKVNTQEQLDSVFAAVPASDYPLIPLNGVAPFTASRAIRRKANTASTTLRSIPDMRRK